MKVPLTRMEQANAHWKNACRALRAEVILLGPKAIRLTVLHALVFVDQLVTDIIAALSPQRMNDRYVGPHGSQFRSEFLRRVGPIAHWPILFAEFCRHGSRVVVLDAATQQRAAGARTPTSWRGFLWGFQAFAVELATPITAASGTSYDTLLSWRKDVGGRKLVHLALLSPTLGAFPALAPSLEQDCAEGDFPTSWNAVVDWEDACRLLPRDAFKVLTFWEDDAAHSALPARELARLSGHPRPQLFGAECDQALDALVVVLRRFSQHTTGTSGGGTTSRLTPKLPPRVASCERDLFVSDRDGAFDAPLTTGPGHPRKSAPVVPHKRRSHRHTYHTKRGTVVYILDEIDVRPDLLVGQTATVRPSRVHL